MNPHRVARLPILILYPHRRCNCRCVMCDIWKDTEQEELTATELERHLEDICSLQVQWMVFSGGEPLMHSDLFRLAAMVRALGIRVTILTAGLMLERHARAITDAADDVIVSLDGPPAIHDEIRRIQGAFRRMATGIEAIHQLNPKFPVSARSTIQRRNHDVLCATAQTAFDIGCHSISFLAIDLISESFNRVGGLSVVRQEQLGLSSGEISHLESGIRDLLAHWEGTGFVAENAEKFGRIVNHFRSHLGETESKAPQCNAPWTSAVVESDGSVRPCFFHKAVGNVRNGSLRDVLNGAEAVEFRSRLDVANNPICKRCVCALNWKQSA